MCFYFLHYFCKGNAKNLNFQIFDEKFWISALTLQYYGFNLFRNTAGVGGGGGNVNNN